MASTLRLASVLALVVANLGAQQTWVVDPTGAGNFTSLSAAIAAATAGDTLVLRGGDYPGTHQLAKSLTFVGDLPRARVGALIFSGLPTGSPPILMTGFDAVAIEFPNWLNAPVVAAFEDITVTRVRVGPGHAFQFHRCTIGGSYDPYGQVNTLEGIRVVGSDVTLSACTVSGGRGWTSYGGLIMCNMYAGGVAADCVGILGGPLGRLTISDCSVSGSSSVAGSGFCGALYTPGGSALWIFSNAQVRVTNSVIAAGWNLSTNPVPAVLAAFSINYSFESDPSTTFQPATSLGTATFLPGTGGLSSAPGGTISCRAESGPNLPAVLVASLGVHGPTSLPQGIVWIDPAAFVVLVIGFTDPSGVLSATIPVPAWAPRGLPITVQSGVAPGTNGPLTPGTPVVLHVL